MKQQLLASQIWGRLPRRPEKTPGPSCRILYPVCAADAGSDALMPVMKDGDFLEAEISQLMQIKIKNLTAISYNYAYMIQKFRGGNYVFK